MPTIGINAIKFAEIGFLMNLKTYASKCFNAYEENIFQDASVHSVLIDPEDQTFNIIVDDIGRERKILGALANVANDLRKDIGLADKVQFGIICPEEDGRLPDQAYSLYSVKFEAGFDEMVAGLAKFAQESGVTAENIGLVTDKPLSLLKRLNVIKGERRSTYVKFINETLDLEGFGRGGL